MYVQTTIMKKKDIIAKDPLHPPREIPVDGWAEWIIFHHIVDSDYGISVRARPYPRAFVCPYKKDGSLNKLQYLNLYSM